MENHPPAIANSLFPDLPPAPTRQRIIQAHRLAEGHTLTGFRRGWLFLFKPMAVQAIRLWPSPQYWVAGNGGCWVRRKMDRLGMEWLTELRHSGQLEPGLKRVASLWMDGVGQGLMVDLMPPIRRLWWNRAHARMLVATVPEEAMECIQGTRDAEGLRLLRFLSLGTEAQELFRSNPGVGYILAVATSLWRDLYPAAARAMVAWPQRHILRALGFPETESMRKLLRKVDTYSLEVGFMQRLRRLAKSERALALLRQTKVVDSDLLHLIEAQKFHHLLTPDFVAEYAALDDIDRINFNTPDGLELLAEAAKHGFWHERPLRSLGHYRKQVARVRRACGTTVAPFPEPPTEGDLSLIPLRSGAELVQAGKMLENCLGRTPHLLDALNGKAYFYRILLPYPGAFELRRLDDGRWTLGEFRWARNEIPGVVEFRSLSQRMKELLGKSFTYEGSDFDSILLNHWRRLERGARHHQAA